MENLSSIDKNFAASTADNMVYFDLADRLDLCYGLEHNDEGFYRISKDIAKDINASVLALSASACGGRMRFITDSRVISLKAQLGDCYPSANMTLLGSAGFDMYEQREGRWIYRGCFPPSEDGDKNLEAALVLPDEGEHELLINFPIHASVEKLWLGLSKDCIAKRAEYSRKEKVLYYGSSITQGGCASRPGTAYTAMISRMLDIDYVNLGFSSGAHAEEKMTEFLSRVSCDLLVIDYDHNAPDPAFLERTHEKFYKAMRTAHPGIPIILASAPVAELNPGKWDERRDIIKKTYDNARAAGDNLIWFIDGSEVFDRENRENCMIDQWHPNDLGMHCMAKAFAAVIKEALN